MIKLVKEGKYELFESKSQTKILTLDKKIYAWINAQGIGEILVYIYKIPPLDCILSAGNYRLYEVKNEPNLTDLLHLELFVGNGIWQGYLLISGLPGRGKKRVRIIPTNEKITVPSSIMVLPHSI